MISVPLCASRPATVSAALCLRAPFLLAAQKPLLSRILVTSSMPSEFPALFGLSSCVAPHLSLETRPLLDLQGPAPCQLSSCPSIPPLPLFPDLPDLSVMDYFGARLSDLFSFYTRSTGNLTAFSPVCVLLGKAQTYISSPAPSPYLYTVSPAHFQQTSLLGRLGHLVNQSS